LSEYYLIAVLMINYTKFNISLNFKDTKLFTYIIVEHLSINFR